MGHWPPIHRRIQTDEFYLIFSMWIFSQHELCIHKAPHPHSDLYMWIFSQYELFSSISTYRYILPTEYLLLYRLKAVLSRKKCTKSKKSVDNMANRLYNSIYSGAIVCSHFADLLCIHKQSTWRNTQHLLLIFVPQRAKNIQQKEIWLCLTFL